MSYTRTPYANVTTEPWGDAQVFTHAYASNVDLTGNGVRIILSAFTGPGLFGDEPSPAHLKVENGRDEVLFEASAADYRFSDVPVTGDLWADLNRLWQACADERCLQLAVKALF